MIIKNNLKFLFIIPIIFTLTFCGHTKEEKDSIKEYKEQGEKNAINYIEQKYGFTPTINKINAETEDPYMVPDFFPKPTGRVEISASYNNKTFKMEIQGDRITDEGRDDYQYDEIVSDILEIVKKDTKIEPHNYSIKLGYNNYENLIYDYYSKDNLYELLSNNNSVIILEYINSNNLIDNKFENITENFKKVSLFGIINYKSKTTYAKRSENIDIITSNIDNYLDDNMLYIDNAFTIELDTPKYKNMRTYEFDDLYFYDSNDYKEIKISKTNIEDVKEWIGHGTSNPKQISDAYLIKTDARVFYVYFPINKTKFINKEELKLGIVCETDNGKKYSTSHLNKSGDYYSIIVSLYSCKGEAKITLLQNK